MGLASIREELRAYNAVCDGPCGVLLMWDGPEEHTASLVCADQFALEPVVDIPGDDRPFPVEACAKALACSRVKEWPWT